MFKRDFTNRRRKQRQLLNGGVQVFTGSSQMHALGINLSDVGMCLFTVAHLPIGSQIEVEFFPPQSKERVRLAGTVRHRALYLYGIEFLVESDENTQSCSDAKVLITQ
jgi:hypothetical protein